MSDKNSNHQFNSLSDSHFLKFIRTIYENNINHCKLIDLDFDQRQRLAIEIFTRLQSFDSNSINLCLEVFALFTQQCEGIELLTTPIILESLQKLAGLQCDKIDVNPIDMRNAIEAEKCMSTLISSSSIAQKFFSISGVADAITQRIKETSVIKLNDDLRFFDMRMLFLLTTVNPDIRQRVRETFHGLSYLFEIINQIILSKSELVDSELRESKRIVTVNRFCTLYSSFVLCQYDLIDVWKSIRLSNEDIDYLIEILKTLSNLTIDLPNLTHCYDIQEEEEGHLMRLVSILRELILCYGPNDEKQIELRSHIINLLINMPTTCYEELLSPVVPEDGNGNNGKNIDAIDVILHFLDDRITKLEENENIKQGLISVLQLLILMCQANRTIRKFCRQFILSTINEEEEEEEEKIESSDEEQILQDKIKRLINHSNSQLKTLSTKLLFILCKENVNRLVKYTGLINANEVLYELGILNFHENSNKDQYSSDSDQFDTENDRIIDDQ